MSFIFVTKGSFQDRVEGRSYTADMIEDAAPLQASIIKTERHFVGKGIGPTEQFLQPILSNLEAKFQ